MYSSMGCCGLFNCCAGDSKQDELESRPARPVITHESESVLGYDEPVLAIDCNPSIEPRDEQGSRESKDPMPDNNLCIPESDRRPGSCDSWKETADVLGVKKTDLTTAETTNGINANFRKNPRQEALRKAHFRMITDMTDVQRVLSYIYSKLDIPKNSREQIETEILRYQQASKLMSLLENLGDEGYDLFRDALLNTEQPHLANILPAFGNIRFLLGNVSQMEVNCDYPSDSMKIAGAKWHLSVKISRPSPRRLKRVNVTLNYEPKSSRKGNFLVKRVLLLFRQNPKQELNNLVKDGSVIFPDPITGSKIVDQDIICYGSVLDPENGWLQNDSMLITCQLEVERILLGNKAEGILSWVLEGVSEFIDGETRLSDPQILCGIRWRLILRCVNEEGEKYLAIGIKGEEADFFGRRFYEAHQIKLNRYSQSQPDLVDEGISVLPNAISGSTDSGNPRFIKVDQLMDPRNNWVENNSIHVTCTFKLMQIKEINI